MRGQTFTHPELLNAIHGANERAGFAPDADGTFRAAWAPFGMVDRARAPYGSVDIERVTEERGYEVAYDTVINLTVETPRAYLAFGDRFGVWTDPDTLEVFLDRTVFLVAPERLALELAHEWEQKAIWGWERQECLNVAEALDLV